MCQRVVFCDFPHKKRDYGGNVMYFGYKLLETDPKFSGLCNGIPRIYVIDYPEFFKFNDGISYSGSIFYHKSSP